MSDWLYDWMKDLAVPALAGIGGIIVGTGAMVAAFTSNRVASQSLTLAQQVRDDERAREAAAARDRYRDQLIRVIEPAITELVAYGNIVFAAERVDTPAEVQQRAAALSRLLLVSSVALGSDRQETSAVAEAFARKGESFRWQVRVQVAGRIAEALAEFLRADPNVSVAENIRNVWAEEEQRAVEREREAAQQAADLARERAEMEAEDVPTGLK